MSEKNGNYSQEIDLGIQKTSSILRNYDKNLTVLENILPVDLLIRSGVWKFTGDEKLVQKSIFYINSLLKLVDSKIEIEKSVLERVWKATNVEDQDVISDTFTREIIKTQSKSIYAKTKNQSIYIRSIEKSTLTFGVGPAGSGKTFLAVAMAVKDLKEGNVKKIILTRPAVEAGERLGFLPGSLSEKIDPYLKPLFDAMNELLSPKITNEFLESGIIEVVPLAFMRGRTLNDSFIILDEAQNTTSEQMKMFLTRLGDKSKMVITGDISQIDLPRNTKSGLKQALKILDNVKDISIIYLTSEDIVRNSLVTKIVNAYSKQEVV